MNHISLKEIGLDIYAKSPNAQEAFWPVPSLISYTGVTGRLGLLHCKRFLTQFCYLVFSWSACTVEHSGVPLPALDSTQIKNLIWLSRTLVNVMGEYFGNEIVQSCGKVYETEITKMG